MIRLGTSRKTVKWSVCCGEIFHVRISLRRVTCIKEFVYGKKWGFLEMKRKMK